MNAHDGPSAEAMVGHTWLGMSFDVPGAWEIARHAVSGEKGRLVFVDRRHQRLSLSWLAIAPAPDAQRQMSDCRDRDREQHPQAAFSGMTRVNRWQCYRMAEGALVTTRAGTYEKSIGRWVEAVIVWPEGADDTMERRILESFSASSADAAGRRTRAFGVDVAAPDGWRLSAASVLPADLTLGYLHPQGSATVRRTKLASELQDRGLDARIIAQAGRIRVHPTRHRGHEGCRAESRERRFAPRWLWGGRRLRFDLAWRCVRANACYHIALAVDPGLSVRPEHFDVTCCPEAS